MIASTAGATTSEARRGVFRLGFVGRSARFVTKSALERAAAPVSFIFVGRPQGIQVLAIATGNSPLSRAENNKDVSQHQSRP